MTKVNANDRSTLERTYPEDAFKSDAAQNERVPNAVRHGVRIGSAPDAEGYFELERAARHAGEPETPTFPAPTRAAVPEQGMCSFSTTLLPRRSALGSGPTNRRARTIRESAVCGSSAASHLLDRRQ